jgi:hypothetical protein
MGLRRIASVRTRVVLGVVAAAAVAAVSASGAGALTLPVATTGTSSSATTHTSKSSSAGQPMPNQDLLCGMWSQGSDRISGGSNIDHPSGAMATGNVYPYTGQNCDSNSANSSGMFTWTIAHSNVNTVETSERGTEHGEFMLSTGTREAGFDGHITNYDFGVPPLTAPAPDPCTNRDIYYASGHIGAYDSAGSCSPSGPGNFNTHGGAQTGSHFRGNYGTVVYQQNNNPTGSCPSGGSTYCFEAILEGQTN